ncbi:hypothetical protein [Spiroplasma endosymbiont of Othius punctulatus]|uniref:hypothetical protein n=1 Tax=Spiroplasma endosymbiont of Othius punctulatus TaxID=3066289 RepID=UPI0030D553EF
MKIEIKKLLNLSANIFKFNYRFKKYWIFVYILLSLAIGIIFTGSIISVFTSMFDAGITLEIMPWFNIIVGLLMALLFIMFSVNPIFRDKELALYDLEKRYGYKAWQITGARLIWIFTMCIATYLIMLFVSLIFGSFGSGGSNMIYLKAYVVPFVWYLYLLLLTPLLTIFVSLIVGAIFGKMIVYGVIVTVALAPGITGFASIFGVGGSNINNGVKRYNDRKELISMLMFDDYFKDLASEENIPKSDFLFEMLEEYNNVASAYSQMSGSISYTRRVARLGVPFWKKYTPIQNGKSVEFKKIEEFYNKAMEVIPTNNLVSNPNWMPAFDEYDANMFSKYISKIKGKKYKKTVDVVNDITSEWKLISSIYGRQQMRYLSWRNPEAYTYASENKLLYDNTLEKMIFNITLSTILDELSKLRFELGDEDVTEKFKAELQELAVMGEDDTYREVYNRIQDASWDNKKFAGIERFNAYGNEEPIGDHYEISIQGIRMKPGFKQIEDFILKFGVVVNDPKDVSKDFKEWIEVSSRRMYEDESDEEVIENIKKYKYYAINSYEIKNLGNDKLLIHDIKMEPGYKDIIEFSVDIIPYNGLNIAASGSNSNTREVQDFTEGLLPSEELMKKGYRNPFLYLLNPFNQLDLIFMAPIQSKNYRLIETYMRTSAMSPISRNYDFRAVYDNNNNIIGTRLVKVVSAEWVIAVHFIVMIALYFAGYLLWKRKILK